MGITGSSRDGLTAQEGEATGQARPPNQPPVESVAAVSVAIVTLAILVAAAIVGPVALANGSLDQTNLLAGAVGVLVGSLVGATRRSWNLAARIIVTVVVTALVVGGVVGGIHLLATAPGRDAKQRAAAWPVVATQDFENPTYQLTPPTTSDFGRSESRFEDGRLVFRLSTHRDFTHQVATSVHPISVRDFYTEVDVQLLSGPRDSYCGVLFRWHDNEHWIAFKLGWESFQITQNHGRLPHQRFADPAAAKAVRPGKVNKLAILAGGTAVRFFINQQEVSEQEIDDPDGQVWLAGQAATTSSVLRCAFDNVLVRASP